MGVQRESTEVALKGPVKAARNGEKVAQQGRFDLDALTFSHGHKGKHKAALPLYVTSASRGS